MTAFELRTAIAEALGFIVLKKKVSDITIADVMVKGNDPFIPLFDFNNWNDLMPLVIEHKIQLKRSSLGLWIANLKGNVGESWVMDKTPQRALAECLLKVLQGESNNES